MNNLPNQASELASFIRSRPGWPNADAEIVDRLSARIVELEAALRPFAEALSVYREFPEHQLILLSEDNPKGRRLAHIRPEHFKTAQDLIGEDDNE